MIIFLRYVPIPNQKSIGGTEERLFGTLKVSKDKWGHSSLWVQEGSYGDQTSLRTKTQGGEEDSLKPAGWCHQTPSNGSGLQTDPPECV